MHIVIKLAVGFHAYRIATGANPWSSTVTKISDEPIQPSGKRSDCGASADGLLDRFADSKPTTQTNRSSKR